MTSCGDNPDRARDSGFPYLLLAALAAMTVGFAVRKIWDVDYWWQLKTGQWIARHGMIHQELFTWSRAGTPRQESGWLYCLGLYKLESLIGPSGLVIVKAMVVAATLAIMLSIARFRTRPILVGLFAGVTIIASSQRFALRPETLSYLLFALMLLIVARARCANTRWVVALPIIQLFWVNVHSYFPLGLGIVALWALDELARQEKGNRSRWRTALITLATTSAACLANPYGLRFLLIPVDQLAYMIGQSRSTSLILVVASVASLSAIFVFWRMPALRRSRAGLVSLVSLIVIVIVLLTLRASEAITLVRSLWTPPDHVVITELMPPLAIRGSFAAIDAYRIILVVTLIVGMAAFRKLDAYWAVLTGSMLLVSVFSVKHIELFALVAIPFVALHAPYPRWFLTRFDRSWTRMIGVSTVCGVCLFMTRQLVTDRHWIHQGDSNQFGIGIAQQVFPTVAAEYLDTLGSQAEPIFNTYGLGAYLLYRDHRVFIDPRGAAGIVDLYVKMLGEKSVWMRVVRRRDIRCCVIDTTEFRFIRALQATGDWRITHADPVAVVLLRRDTLTEIPRLTNEPEWLAEIEQVLGSADTKPGPLSRITNPYPFLSAAGVARILGFKDAAADLTAQARLAYPALFRSQSSRTEE